MTTSPSATEFAQFIQAVKLGHEEDVCHFLTQYPSAVDDRDDSHHNAIYWAVAEGHKDMVSLLLEQGADANIPSLHDILPLQKAAMDNKTGIAEVLLEGGADVNGKNEGRSILMSATFHDASEEMIDLLISRGADVNEQDKNGETALLYTINSSMYSRRNSTPADHARRMNIMRKLLSAGANPNLKWKDNRTPLTYAIFNHAPTEVIAALLKNGASTTLNDRDDSGRTALSYAVEKRRRDIIPLLIQNGADASITDNNGRTVEEGARNKGLNDDADFLHSIAREFNDNNFKTAIGKIQGRQAARNPFKKTPPKP